MTTNPLRLQEAIEKLNCAGGESILDFSAVDRIDAATAGALEELADRSSVRITLRGVNIGVYRALKLLKLAHRFSFIS
jgi:anti-anti-sigma regulatory factor